MFRRGRTIFGFIFELDETESDRTCIRDIGSKNEQGIRDKAILLMEYGALVVFFLFVRCNKANAAVPVIIQYRLAVSEIFYLFVLFILFSSDDLSSLFYLFRVTCPTASTLLISSNIDYSTYPFGTSIRFEREAIKIFVQNETRSFR